MSLAAAQLALDDAKYDPAERPTTRMPPRSCCRAGSGGNEFGQREIQALWSQGPQAVTAYQSIAWFYAASTGQTSIRHGTKGPATVLVSEGAGGLDSVGARPPHHPTRHPSRARRWHRGAAVAVRAGVPGARAAG